MIQGTKEAIELFHITILRQQVSGLPVEEPVKGERPDFLWPNLDEPLGVEITRLFKKAPKGQRPMQVQESESNATVQLARQICQERNLPNLEIRVIFGSREIKKSDRTSLANELADVVQRRIPAPNSWVSLRNHFDDNSALPDEVSYLSIARFDFLEKNHWSVSDAAVFCIQQAGSNRQTENGWRVWRNKEDEYLQDLRDQLLNSRTSGANGT